MDNNNYENAIGASSVQIDGRDDWKDYFTHYSKQGTTIPQEKLYAEGKNVRQVQSQQNSKRMTYAEAGPMVIARNVQKHAPEQVMFDARQQQIMEQQRQYNKEWMKRVALMEVEDEEPDVKEQVQEKPEKSVKDILNEAISDKISSFGSEEDKPQVEIKDTTKEEIVEAMVNTDDDKVTLNLDNIKAAGVYVIDEMPAKEVEIPDENEDVKTPYPEYIPEAKADDEYAPVFNGSIMFKDGEQDEINEQRQEDVVPGVQVNDITFSDVDDADSLDFGDDEISVGDPDVLIDVVPNINEVDDNNNDITNELPPVMDEPKKEELVLEKQGEEIKESELKKAKTTKSSADTKKKTTKSDSATKKTTAKKTTTTKKTATKKK